MRGADLQRHKGVKNEETTNGRKSIGYVENLLKINHIWI